MRHPRRWVLAAVAVLVLTAPPARAQSVTCTGVPAWNASTIYNPGDRIVFNDKLYQAVIQIWNTPPDYCPPCNWYTLLGTCGAGGADTTPPSVPTGLTSPSQTATSVSLAWNASTDNAGGSGVAGYDVLRNGVQVGSPTATSFTDAGLASNTAFSYTVRARDNAGNRSAASAALSVRTRPPSGCTTLPSVPGGLRSPSQTTSSVALAWNASTPGANCTVQYRVFQGGVQAAQTANTSVTITGLASGATFTFTVVAVNEFGSSAQSAALSVATMGGGGGGAPTAAELLAKLGSCTQASNGLFSTDSGGAATIPICRLNGALFWKADMDIDCDGVRTDVCNEQRDPAFQADTSAHTSTGQPLNAKLLPYVVIPSASSRFNFGNFNIQLGAVVAVIFNNQVQYAVFGDTGPTGIIGEASFATAQSLGIDPDPATGGTDGPVWYIVFQGSNVSPIEDHTRAVTLGQQLARQFVNSN
jgi:chitodextrinase